MPTLRCSMSSIMIILLLASNALAQDEPTDRPMPPLPQIRGASAPSIGVVFTNIAGDPSAAVPGLSGVEFNPGSSSQNFDRIYGSPNGNWILSAVTSAPSTEDEVILVNGVTVAREGTPAPWTSGAEIIGPIARQLGINDAGDWAFATNTDGPIESDEYVVRNSGGIFAALAQEAQPVNFVPGATWGSELGNVVIDAIGNVGVLSRNLGGVDPGRENVLTFGNVVLAQSGVTVPSGQVGSEFWDDFDVNGFFLSADGTQWLARGDLTGDTNSDDVVAVNGEIVVQEGVILLGTDFSEPVDAGGIVGEYMDSAGNWFVRGNNDVTEQDWIYRNNAVLTTLGEPIFTGASEVWSDAEFSDCFFMHVSNSRGDYVIGGVSDGPTQSNGMLVANNAFVVVRESDPLDLNGNGINDDDLFFSRFGNDDGFLSDDGLFYFVATLKNGAGTTVGQGVFVTDLRPALGMDEIFADRFE